MRLLVLFLVVHCRKYLMSQNLRQRYRLFMRWAIHGSPNTYAAKVQNILYSPKLSAYYIFIEKRSPTAETPTVRSETFVRRYVCEIIDGCAQHLL